MSTINGGSGNDILNGTTGDDVIYGGDGNDVIFGGPGNDKLYGGKGDDIIHLGPSAPTGSQSTEAYGGHGDDTFYSGGGTNAYMYGGKGDDVFFIEPAAPGVPNHNVYVYGGSGRCDDDMLNFGPALAAGYKIVSYTQNPDSSDPGAWTGNYILENGSGQRITVNYYQIERVVPCFTPGTLIATPTGERPVEMLRIGDRIITRDNGMQEIRWIGRNNLGLPELKANRDLLPVLIRRGALGRGLPERDMLVSPNHRVLVANDRTQLLFEEREVLVAAKHLVNNAGIEVASTLGASYIHFMFDNHEVVLSDGAWTESFQPGDLSLRGMGNSQRQEILSLFPELKSRKGVEEFGAARRTLRRHEAQML